MATRFEAAVDRLNRAVFLRLANADVVFPSAEPIQVIFDNGYSAGNVGMLGMASTNPNITLPTASVPVNPVGTAVVVAGVSYTVATHEPDGHGVSNLLLERA